MEKGTEGCCLILAENLLAWEAHRYTAVVRYSARRRAREGGGGGGEVGAGSDMGWKEGQREGWREGEREGWREGVVEGRGQSWDKPEVFQGHQGSYRVHLSNRGHGRTDNLHPRTRAIKV